MAASMVQTGRGRFEAYVGGSGPAVLMIPPLGRSGSDYTRLGRDLNKLGYMSIAVNPRGVAGSGPTVGPATLDDLSNDVVAIMDALKISSAHLIGHAVGNRVARRIAVLQPARVASVILLAAGGKVPIPAWASEALTRIYDPATPEDQREQDLRATCFSASFKGSIQESGWLSGWWPEAAHSQRAGGRSATQDMWWHAGIAPLLVIQGLDDVFAPPENGRSLRDEFPDRVTLIEFEATGHALLQERPHAVTSAIAEFLALFSKPDL